MMNNIKHHSVPKRLIAALGGLAMMVSLAACGDNVDPTDSSGARDGNVSGLSGEFHGAGASSQQGAVEAWIATFQKKNRKARIAYNPSGSGAGVTTFLTGAIAWAGTDAPLTDEQVEASKSVCKTGTAFEVPVYISPIAVFFNLKGISGPDKHLNMDASTVARVFSGSITKWNDQAIVEQNPKVSLPDLPITVVHRSDKSGTTNNFTSYLKAAAPEQWPHDPQENWPNDVGQAAKGNSGVVSSVGQADGTIGYADNSKVIAYGTVAVKVGNGYVAPSQDGATKTVSASPAAKHVAKGSGRVVLDVDYATKETGSYPVVSVSYAVACRAYKDAQTGLFMRSWLGYMVGADGQQVAADNTGSARFTGDLADRAAKSVANIDVE
ncbi:phosphate ABC transporter substrate-binding protein, PhoT family (TC 3.A.1.7.1) [Bifidobacterium bohemicum]|uniref:Phosphate-binding protein n=1 Tax=Bifidobacterium bohemicum DSM 22767 TaxID=1437606 RepID=A0A086ZE74_9BIFI|nr:phosphate ABC transporter substrate-binding protein PstS [Bifidobacterium bohemicum]KFI44824.1 phosphate ABC superfamily transporter [Bifidobacterium bohemicum DSM 22767]SCB94819.1 phosphate ABC transporter substrate-binding protein, PhoT family (TC 3.A.1.7.1) [Bifidobacterium bohemicum]